MKSFIALFTALAGLASFAVAEVELYAKCGGVGYKGETTCVRGAVCTVINRHYSRCLPAPKIRADDSATGFAALGNTVGGAGGPTVRVSTLAALKSAVSGDSPKIVILTSSLSGSDCVEIGSNTSLYGTSGVTLNGIGFRILNASNVIIRNLVISKVLASVGDAIGVQQSSRVWVDHVELSSDLDHGKDYYDGLLDITHGCTYVTVSRSHFHDHWKSSLVGHSDTNGEQDKAITVTYSGNYFGHVNSRCPSVRFGQAHIYNNYYYNITDGIDTREGAELLVENNIFVNVKDPMFSTNTGYAVSRNNNFGSGVNTAPNGTLTSVPYSYTLESLDTVRSGVPSGAGATLSIN